MTSCFIAHKSTLFNVEIGSPPQADRPTVPSTMTTSERILEYKHANQPFALQLSDGRKFFLTGGDCISLNPSGKGTNVIVYGPGEDEEHLIPVFAITSVFLQ